jgi:hypothetical protein
MDCDCLKSRRVRDVPESVLRKKANKTGSHQRAGLLGSMRISAGMERVYAVAASRKKRKARNLYSAFACRVQTMAVGWIYLQSSRSYHVLTFSYLTASLFPGVYDNNCFGGIRRAPLPGGGSSQAFVMRSLAASVR